MVEPRVLPFALCLGLLAGCGLTGAPTPPTPPRPTVEDLDLELRALLLLIEDRGLFEPTVVGQAFVSSRVATREALARALGRIDDSRGGGVLLELLADPAPPVRMAAAAGLAAHPSPAVVASLASVAGGDDREVAQAAVASLAALGVPLGEVLEHLRTADSDEVWRRIVPALFQFQAEERFEAASLALAEAPPELRRLAGLALTWDPPPRAVEALRALLDDQDAFVRAAAARVLGELGAAEDLDRLVELVGDHSPAGSSGLVVASALGAIRSLVERGLVAPPSELRPRLIELFAAEEAPARLAAIEASRAWLLDDELETALDRRFVDPGVPVGDRAAVLLAMAAGGAARAGDRVSDAAVSSEPLLREAAAEGAALLGLPAASKALLGDREAGVRAAALIASFELEAEPAAVARSARADPSAAVRATLFSLLERQPVLPHAELVGPAGGDALERERAPATRRLLVLAIAARGRAERLERGAVLETLETVAARDPEHAVRAAAIVALEEMGAAAPEPRPRPGRQELPAYRAIAALQSTPVELSLGTERGRLVLRTDCRAAPKGCLSILQLARQGFYDELRVDDVVPGVEVGFGDPTGTGFGDAGYRSVPELSAFLSAEPGLLLLDCSDPSGCGSRLRLLLVPQPWLADRAVLLGRVISGLDVAARLVPGDTIRSIEVSEEFRIVEPKVEN